MMWEPYDYYVEDKRCFAIDNAEKTREHMIGGDCGLKTKELECNGI